MPILGLGKRPFHDVPATLCAASWYNSQHALCGCLRPAATSLLPREATGALSPAAVLCGYMLYASRYMISLKASFT